MLRAQRFKSLVNFRRNGDSKWKIVECEKFLMIDDQECIEKVYKKNKKGKVAHEIASKDTVPNVKLS